jgi:hypothetical protein
MGLSRRPGPGQAEIPGFESRPGLVHVLTPEYMGLDPAEFADITPPLIELASPQNLRPSLIDVNPNGRSTVGYRPAGLPGYRQIWLAVTPVEFNATARHVEMLGKTALNKTLENHTREEQRTDEVQAKAKRASVHAVESKLGSIETHIIDTSRRLRLISSFLEMTQYPNLARGTVRTVRERFTALRDDVIDDMVLAIGNQREWTEAQSELAKRTIVKRTYLAEPRNERYHNFIEMLGLANEYNGHKLALFLSRRYDARKYIHDRTRPTDDV